MNPTNNEQFSPGELPNPQAGNQTAPLGGENLPASPNETQAAQAIEQGFSSSNPMAAAPPVQSSIPADSQMVPAPSAGLQPTAVTSNGMPAIADDTDLIEKEWVEKAKEIVARTKDDPYLQNKEMNKIKADYIKKRYDKDVKVSED